MRLESICIVFLLLRQACSASGIDDSNIKTIQRQHFTTSNSSVGLATSQTTHQLKDESHNNYETEAPPRKVFLTALSSQLDQDPIYVTASRVNRTKLSIRSLTTNNNNNQQQHNLSAKLPQQQQQQQVKQFDLNHQASSNAGDSPTPQSARNSSSVVSAACATERQQQQQPPTSTGDLPEASADQAPFPADQQLSSSGFVQSRVSDFVKPHFYTLRLKVDPMKRKFSGQLMVSLDITNGPPSSSSSSDDTRRQRSAGASSGTSAGASSINGNGHSSAGGGGPVGHRYLTLHVGLNLHIKRAFYVFTARNNIQIPATKIGRSLEQELLTLDFYPNVITSPGQGFLLLVYTGQVNTTESHGLFVHRRNVNVWGALKSNQFDKHKAATNWTSLSMGIMGTTDQQQQHQQNEPPTPPPQTTAVPSASVNDDYLGLATQMQPSYARRMFPCWDEPQLKARFNLIVILPFRGYECLSNMPVKRKSISLSCSGEPLQEVEFHTTPAMSTYLLALVIGKFDYIESITPNQCKVRAYFYSAIPQQQQQIGSNNYSASDSTQLTTPTPPTLPPPALNQRRQAARRGLEFAVRAFDYLETLLGVKYPLSKFDMIALRDFNSGAMENWGASIFHENYLLCDNSSLNVNIRVNGGTNRPKRLVIPLVVAHEIVHQWFGNLITSRSWTYLWLNEGFAQLLMYDVANNLLPNENYWHIFIEDNRQSAMREDELITSSRALELSDEQLASQGDPAGLFDQLTYNKGALMLRMVQFALGPGEFVAGLHHYLLKHSYDSVTSNDLWLALEESTDRLADRQLELLMTNWLKLEGFPVISVQVSDDSAAYYRLTLTQERFTLLPFGETVAGAAQQSSAHKSVDEHADTNQTTSARAAPTSYQSWSDWVWSVPITVASQLRPSPSNAELRLWPLRPTQTSSATTTTTTTDGSGATGSGAPPLEQRTTIASSWSLAGNTIMLGDKSATLLVPKSSLGAWFKLNHDAIGYFRVDYKQPSAGQVDMLAQLRAPIREQSMGLVDRLNIIEDLFAMVLSGRKPLAHYLRFILDTYDQESELLVLRFIFDSFDRIKQTIVTNSYTGDLSSSSASSSSTSSSSSSSSRRNDSGQLESQFNGYVRKYLRKLIAALKLKAATGPTLTPDELGGGGGGGEGEGAAATSPMMMSHSPDQHIQLDRLNKKPQWKRSTRATATTTTQLDASVSVAGNDGNKGTDVGSDNWHSSSSSSSGSLNNNNHHNQKKRSNEPFDEPAPTSPSSSSAAAAAFISLNQQLKQQLKHHHQQQQQQQANENNFAELLELLDSIRLTYNEAELSQHGAELFARHYFRPPSAATVHAHVDSSSSSSSSAASSSIAKSPFELMGRDLRASIYANALNYNQLNLASSHTTTTTTPLLLQSIRRAQQSQLQQQPTRLYRPSTPPADELFPSVASASMDFSHEPMPRLRNVAGNQNFSSAQLLQNYDDHVTPATAPVPVSNRNSAGDERDEESLTPPVGSSMSQDRVFSKLLELYYSSDHTTSPLERSAIAQALGGVRNVTKQAYLLNLTLGIGSGGPGPFRFQDAGLLLDSMAQTKSGRRLIWTQINDNMKLFKQRQLLSVALKCVSRGLIEQQQQLMQQSDGDKNLNNGDTREPLITTNEAEIGAESNVNNNYNGQQQQQQQSNQQAVERQLRQLYVIYGASEHGQLIGQAIEWVRINTLWFKRDHAELTEFLKDTINQ